MSNHQEGRMKFLACRKLYLKRGSISGRSASKRHTSPIASHGMAFALEEGRRLILSPRRHLMNWDRVKGNWKDFKGKVKEKWGKLTDDDLTAINGQKDQLVGKLQKAYGYQKDEAERQIDEATHGW
jgi:uncharacterized protein YjbJ (UPF0337 family)